ncbi:MAG: ATP-binding protein [Phocaeicola sp.]
MKSSQSIIKLLLILSIIYSPFNLALALSPMSAQSSKDTLVFKGDADFPPYEFLNEKGEPNGFTIELIHAIMQELNMPYKIELDVWHKVYQDYLDGKVDVITSLAYTKKRSKMFIYGPIHSYTQPNAIISKNNTPVRKKKDLIGRTIIAQNSDLYHEILANEVNVKLTDVEQVSDAFRLLPTIKNGVVLCDDKLARSIIYRYGFKDLVFSDIDIPKIATCFAGRDEEIIDRISHGFATVKSKGIYNQLTNKWLENDDVQKKLSIFYAIAALLALLAFSLYLFVILLRRRVKENTQEIVNYVHQIEEILRFSEIDLWQYDLKTNQITIYNGSHEVKAKMDTGAYLTKLLPEDREKMLKRLELLKQGTNTPFKFEQSYLSESGKVKYLIVNGSPNYNKELKTVKYAGMIRDITDLKEIQFTLNREKEKAQQSDKLKSAFLANMSHEIRTPLNAIVGFSDLLQYTDSAEEREQYIKIINSNNELLLRLINDILDLSKIEAGAMELHFQEFKVNTLFDNLALSLLPRLEENRAVQLLVNHPKENYCIYLDYNRLVQLVTNFAINAIKNTHKGTIEIGYTYHTNGIRVYVEDTGIGIPQSEQHRIFRRFEKVNDFVQGSGLGLSICKAIVETFKGEIGFTSEEGKGSTFWAWIPCKVIEKED